MHDSTDPIGALPSAYGPAAARLLARAAPLVEAEVDEFIEQFYSSLAAQGWEWPWTGETD